MIRHYDPFRYSYWNKDKPEPPMPPLNPVDDGIVVVQSPTDKK